MEPHRLLSRRLQNPNARSSKGIFIIQGGSVLATMEFELKNFQLITKIIYVRPKRQKQVHIKNEIKLLLPEINQ